MIEAVSHKMLADLNQAPNVLASLDQTLFSMVNLNSLFRIPYIKNFNNTTLDTLVKKQTEFNHLINLKIQKHVYPLYLRGDLS